MLTQSRFPAVRTASLRGTRYPALDAVRGRPRPTRYAGDRVQRGTRSNQISMPRTNAASGYVAKISMLRLDTGAGMHELSLSMPEPMLSLSILILATYPLTALEGTNRNQNQIDISKFQHVAFW